MKNSLYGITPEFGNAVYQGLMMVLLTLLWMNTDESIAGFIMILALSILMLVRWRFTSAGWTFMGELLVVLVVSNHWPAGNVALVLVMYQVLAEGRLWMILPIVAVVFLKQPNAVILLALGQAFFVGVGFRGWRLQKKEALAQMDEDSKKRYELESLKTDLITAHQQVAKMAQISERSRIAKDIHDDAGHEIIAAYMSLQAVEDVMNTHPEEALELFKSGLERLEKGIGKIRETVHNLEPLTEIGADRLRKLCQDFTFCPVSFQLFGNANQVPVYHWNILEPCLKEGLTNVMKHADATYVNVTLDITPYLVRLFVENDGMKPKGSEEGPGIGLRNLRQRVQAVGGTVSVDSTNGFRLVCLLPLETMKGKEPHHETLNR